MATASEIEDALRNADAAGDTQAAQKLADVLVQMRGSGEAQPQQDQGAPLPSYKEFRAQTGDPMGPGERLERYGEGLLDTFTNTLGVVGDELTAVEAATVGRKPGGGTFDIGNYEGSWQDRYSAALEAERRQNKQFAQEFPVQNFAAMGAGMYANPLARRSAAWAMKPATMGGKIARGATVGGGTGAVYGAAEGEGGIEGRAGNAAPGAIIGALLGGGIPLAASGVGKGLNWAGDRLGSVRDRLIAELAGDVPQFSSASARKMVEGAARDFPTMTPEEAVIAANQRRQTMGPNAVMGDTGPNLRGLTAATERAPGPGKTIIRDKIVPRQEGVRDPVTRELQGGQAGRVGEFLDDLVPENTTAMRAGLKTSDEIERGFYKDAYAANQQMDSPELRRILKTPLIKRALKQISESFRNRGKNVSPNDPELTALVRELVQIEKMADPATGAGIGRGLRLEPLDLIKRELDFIARKGGGSQIPKVAREATDARILARELRDELDRLDVTARAGPKSVKAEGGAYAQARARAQKRIRARDALKDGETFLNRGTMKNPDELRAVMAEMEPQELNAFRVSFVGALKNKVGNTKRWLNSTRDLYNDKNLEDKISLVFGDQKTFARYIDFLEGGESPMFETYAAITKGSPTALRIAEDADAKKVPGLALAGLKQIAGSPASPGAWLGGLGKLGGAAGQRLARDPATMREQMARALMSGEITPEIAAKGAGAARLSEANKRALARALMAGQVTGTQSVIGP